MYEKERGHRKEKKGMKIIEVQNKRQPSFGLVLVQTIYSVVTLKISTL